jgi:gluconolactonase
MLALVALFSCTPSEKPGIQKEIQWKNLKVEKVADGFQFTEGPAWHKAGYLLFSDIPANKIYKWTKKDQVEVYCEDSGKSNGLAFDGKGRLISCEHWNRRVARKSADGAIVVLAPFYDGKRFNSPNDLTLRSDGTIFFTDPPYGLEGREKEQPCNALYRVRPGQNPVRLVKDFNMPNGLALSPDEKTLYVGDSKEGHVRVFRLDTDGNVSGGEVFCTVPGPDGMKVDGAGHLYVTSSEGIAVFDPRGKRLGTIKVPEKPANCAFGGEDNKTLFITARKSLYRVRL